MQAIRTLSLCLTSLALVSAGALAGDGQSCSKPSKSTCDAQSKSCQGSSVASGTESCSQAAKAQTVAFEPLTEEEGTHLVHLLKKVVQGEPIQPSPERLAAFEAKLAAKVGVWNAKSDEATCAKAKEYASCPISALADELAAKPAGWALLEPKILAHFQSEKACCDSQRRLTQLMSAKGCEVAHGVAARIQEAAPAAFGDDHLIALAENGSKPAWKALMARWEDGKLESVMPIALYAMHYDEVCEVTTASLHEAVDKNSYDWGSYTPAMVSALALERHGEVKPLQSLRTGTHAAVLAALDAGEVDQARNLALRAKYFAGVSEWKVPMRLAFVQQDLATFVKKQLAEYETADQVFDLIESITPLD